MLIDKRLCIDRVCYDVSCQQWQDCYVTCRGRGMEGGVLCSCCTECKSDLDVYM